MVTIHVYIVGNTAASATNTFTDTHSASHHTQHGFTARKFHWPNYEVELKATQEYLSKAPDFSVYRF
jgi:hypothetical protein